MYFKSFVRFNVNFVDLSLCAFYDSNCSRRGSPREGGYGATAPLHLALCPESTASKNFSHLVSDAGVVTLFGFHSVYLY